MINKTNRSILLFFLFCCQSCQAQTEFDKKQWADFDPKSRSNYRVRTAESAAKIVLDSHMSTNAVKGLLGQPSREGITKILPKSIQDTLRITKSTSIDYINSLNDKYAKSEYRMYYLTSYKVLGVNMNYLVIRFRSGKADSCWVNSSTY